MKNQKLSSFLDASRVVEDSDHLFSGIWIRWRRLTDAEKLVSASIILTPVWWFIGWGFFMMLFVGSILTYQFLRQGELRLRRPSLVVFSLVTFSLYSFISLFFYKSYNGERFIPSDFVAFLSGWFCPAIMLWYITSNKIRVRLSVIAWAFSVLVAEMFITWLFIVIVLRQGSYTIPLNLAGILTGAGPFEPAKGTGNYLRAYLPTDVSIPGMSRYIFFFAGPEALAVVAGSISILALDIKNRLWSRLLFASAFFLMLLSGTRSSWLAMPTVLILRFLVKASKAGGLMIICALIAVLSFTTLSLPSVTDVLLKTTAEKSQATGELRGNSTEVRSEIYRRTRERISEASEQNLFLGHVIPGETVLPEYPPAMVGTHSFILGALLYRSGLIGTSIFSVYWLSLIVWFFNTRANRPMSCLLIHIFFSYCFAVMELESTVMPVTLICALIYEPATPTLKRIEYA
jgi:hypothetical protein